MFYAAIKAGLAVVEQSHARQFARYSSDFHKNRLWVAELKMLAESRVVLRGRNISWDAAGSLAPRLPSHLTEPQRPGLSRLLQIQQSA